MPCRRPISPLVLVITLALVARNALTSEFPERECCDAEETDAAVPDTELRQHHHYDVHYQSPTDLLFVPSPPELTVENVDLIELELDENDLRVPEFIPELTDRVTAPPPDGDNDLKATTGQESFRFDSIRIFQKDVYCLRRHGATCPA